MHIFFDITQPIDSTFFFLSYDDSPADGDYRVLDVDYDRLAVVYSCTQLAFLKYELGWILTREPLVDQAVVNKAVINTGLGKRMIPRLRESGLLTPLVVDASSCNLGTTL